MVFQELALRIGSEVVKHVASRWLSIRKEQHDRNSELTDMLTASMPDVLSRRRLERQLQDIADQVAARLTPLYEQEFRDVPEEERQAAVSTVVDTLLAADLSDDALFAADVDSRKLASAIRAQIPDATGRGALSEGAGNLYEALLDECCRAVVSITQHLPQFDPRAATEQLGRLTRLAEDVGEVLQRLPRTSLTAPAGTELDAEFRDRYLTTVSRRLDRLKLFGVDPQHNPSTRVSVAYLSLTVTSDDVRHARQRDDRWFTDRLHLGERSRVRVEDALAEHQRTLLLGDAGLGKTTLLQWLSVHSARGAFTGPLAGWNGRIPFLVRLRDHPDGKLPGPEQFLSSVAANDGDLMPKGWVHRQLVEHGLLLVDGVDEVAPAQRLKVRDWLEELVDQYPGLPVVVTSRPPAVHKTWLRDLGFGPVRLERMGSSQVTEFVRRWHAAIRDTAQKNPSAVPCSIEEVGGYESAMLRHLDSMPHLRSLATTPLLCALLCAVNLSRSKQVPSDRMGLYDVAVTMLADRRDPERRVPHTMDLKLKAKLAVLRNLAWWMTRNGRVEVSRSQAVKLANTALALLPDSEIHADVPIDANDVVDFLIERSGIIQTPAEGRIEFAHRSFQEYLAAQEAVADDDIGMLSKHSHLDQWRETIVMAAGHATRKQYSELLTRILDRADNPATSSSNRRTLRLLAVTCQEVAEKIDPEIRRRIDNALDATVPPRSKRETRSLASAGSGILRRLPTTLDELTDAKAAACVETAALINGPRAMKLLAGYSSDTRTSVQEALASAWQFFDPEEYANEVLVDAPLDEGRIVISHLSHVRWTRILRNLSSLHLFLRTEVEDLTFLDDARKLCDLTCYPNRPIDPQPVSTHGGLTSIFLGNRGVQSLEGFRDLPLEYLSLQLAATPIDVRPLSSMDTLRELSLRNVGATDLTPLRQLKGLTRLELTECGTDPAELVENLPGLIGVTLDRLPPRGVAALKKSLPSLDALAIHGQGFDLKDLESALEIESLSLTDCPISDITPLSGLVKLRIVNLDRTQVVDIHPLSSLPDLEFLSTTDCPISDITALAELFSLKHVYLDGTHVTNLEPLSKLPKLKTIDVSNCPDGLDLTPLSKLPKKAEILTSRNVDPRGLDAVRERGHQVRLWNA